MIKKFLQASFPSESWSEHELVQRLWSNYGSITRWKSDQRSVIVKHICPPVNAEHPRGWSGNEGHERKIKSYQVEVLFYSAYLKGGHAEFIVPDLLESTEEQDDQAFVLSDLGFDGFLPLSDFSDALYFKCVAWLAKFHAHFFNNAGEGLWGNGSYWHLSTRSDEFNSMPAGPLKSKAQQIAEVLDVAEYKTIIHGDAKWANFLTNGEKVSGLDFQYVGGGVGVKDIAYFMSSCLGEKQLFAFEQETLDFYFQQFRLHVKANVLDCDALEKSWRHLYAFAWADFDRFLQGWAPGHWKQNEYIEHQTSKALRNL